MGEVLTYDDAIERFLATEFTYLGELSNHGPMASEALVSMGLDDRIDDFVAAYQARLEPKEPAAKPIADPEGHLRDVLPGLVAGAAAGAGHGLLRIAHAVRALERGDTEVRRRDLDEATAYWRADPQGLPSPAELAGSTAIDGVIDELPRLEPAFDRAGMLTRTLAAAAAHDDAATALARLAPSSDPATTLDAAAIWSAHYFLVNASVEGADLSAFAFIHGVTMPTMARVLLPYLDDRSARQLESAVAGFVMAAVVGFDVSEPRLGAPSIKGDPRRPTTTGEAGSPPLDPADFRVGAGESLDEHTIKFTDACLGLADRTGSDVPLRAASRRVTSPGLI